MRCGTVVRQVQANDRCWHCVSRHRIHISDWPTVNPSISLGLVYSTTWSYPDQSQPIAPFTHASARQSIQYYITNYYYQSKRRFYSVLGISKDSYIPQHLVSNSDRPSCIPKYRIDLTVTVEFTSNWVPLRKILCEGGDWGAKCAYYWHQIPSINWRWWTSNCRWGGHHIQNTTFQPETGG